MLRDFAARRLADAQGVVRACEARAPLARRAAAVVSPCGDRARLAVLPSERHRILDLLCVVAAEAGTLLAAYERCVPHSAAPDRVLFDPVAQCLWCLSKAAPLECKAGPRAPRVAPAHLDRLLDACHDLQRLAHLLAVAPARPSEQYNLPDHL